MKEILKKFWFVFILATLFLVVIIFFIFDTLGQSNTKHKTNADGEKIIYEVYDRQYLAEDLFKELFSVSGKSSIMLAFENKVYAQSLVATDDIKTDARLRTDQTIQNLKATYGEEYKTIIEKDLASLGFFNGIDDLYNYFEMLLLADEYKHNYALEREDLWANYLKDKQPVLVSHILVKVADKENLTTEEQETMDTIKKELDKGTDFVEVARKYSDDSSSSNGGSVGLTDKDNVASFVSEFHDAIYKLKVGETSSWIETDYGYHIIKITSNAKKDLIASSNFMGSFENYYPNFNKLAIWNLVKTHDLKIDGQEDIVKLITDYYNVKGAK